MKTSAGAAAYLPVARVSNLNQAVEALKAARMLGSGWRYGWGLLWDINLTGPLALVMGGEGQGVSPLLKRTAIW